MINLRFNIDEGRISYSDYYLHESKIDTKDANSRTYLDLIGEQISRELGCDNLGFEYLWQQFINYISNGEFYHYKTLALKKGTPKIKKWLELDNNKPIENLCFIIHSKKLNSKNTIAFWYNLKKPKDGSSLVLAIPRLTRIEFFDWNLNEDFTKQYLVKLEQDYKSMEFDNAELEYLFKYEQVFDHKDYQADPIKFKEWKDFIECINEIYKNSENQDDLDNFFINVDGKYILLTQQNINVESKEFELYDNNLGEPVFNNENDDEDIRWKIVNKNFKIKDYLTQKISDNESTIDELKKDIEDDESKWQQESTKLKELNKKQDEEQKQKELKQKEANELNKQEQELNKKQIDTQKQLKELKDKKQIESLEKSLKAIKSDLDNITKEIKSNQQHLKQINEIFNNNLIQIQNHKNNLYKYEELVKESKSKINYLEYCNKRLDTFISLIQAKEFNECYEVTVKHNLDLVQNKNIPKLEDYIEGEMVDPDLMSISFKYVDFGTQAIINRFNNAIRNVEKGFYKNPLFFLGIRKPDGILNIHQEKSISSEIQSKYKLNIKQANAVSKAINTNSVFYLQGPPGTGKTQTISAISEYLVGEQKNIVMTSSTHEAINNFFDRLNDANFKNPNVVMLKFRANTDEKDNNNYSETSLFKKFKTRMINNIVSENENDIVEEIKKYINKYGDNTPEDYIKFLPRAIVEFIFKNYKDEKENFKDEEDDDDALIEPIQFEVVITKGIEKKLKLKEQKHIEFNKIIELIFNNLKQLNIKLEEIDFNKDYLKQIIDQISFRKDDNKESILFKKLKENYQVNHQDDYEKNFLNYIIENRLINVIGVTTTSKNEIRLNNTTINLYSEYPIDYMIIDEISKCSMPEILSKAILAKKVIFAGDYLQLPPVSNLSNDKIINHLIKENFSLNNEKIEKEDLKREYQEYIDQLFKASFFTELIKIIKTSNSLRDNLPYEFLNESHRFGKSILNIVNKIYPNDEKLKSPSNYEFKETIYNLKLGNKNLSNPAVLINLTRPNKDFVKSHGFKLAIDEFGFDQTGEAFYFNDKKINQISNSTYNQWSAFCIVKIIKQLINDNETINQNKRIAVITLTKSQKQVVKWYIANDNDLKSKRHCIKVDTIDNFQGREEEIVIVDFIRGKTKVEDLKIIKTIKRNIAFLSQIERINVALSRAKQKLIIIGHFNYLNSLKNNRLFQKYFNELSESDNSYFDIGAENE